MAEATRGCRLFLLILLTLKCAMLVWFGPITAPDTGMYASFAEIVRSGTRWTWNADLQSDPMAPTTLRMIGYPTLIAAARLIAGEGWRWLLASFQILLATATLLALWPLRGALGLSDRAMLFALAAYATSEPFVLDATLLTDSIYSSLLILLVAGLSRAALKDASLSRTRAAGLGLLLAITFLLREGTIYLAATFLPLISIASGLVPVLARPQHDNALTRRLLVAVLCLVPLVATWGSYAAWNRIRSGKAFITTGAQTAMLLPLVEAAAREPGIFAGGTPLDLVARQKLQSYDYNEVMVINAQLFEAWQQTALDRSLAVSGKYAASWLAYPGRMLRVTLGHLRENEALLLFRPIDSFREYILWATDIQTDLGRLKSAARDWRMIPLYLADLASKCVSIAIFAAFLLLTPWRAWRNWGAGTASGIAPAWWLLYVGWIGIFALVHVDTRYMAPVLPFAILLGVSDLGWLYHRSKLRRRKLASS